MKAPRHKRPHAGVFELAWLRRWRNADGKSRDRKPPSISPRAGRPLQRHNDRAWIGQGSGVPRGCRRPAGATRVRERPEDPSGSLRAGTRAADSRTPSGRKPAGPVSGRVAVGRLTSPARMLASASLSIHLRARQVAVSEPTRSPPGLAHRSRPAHANTQRASLACAPRRATDVRQASTTAEDRGATEPIRTQSGPNPGVPPMNCPRHAPSVAWTDPPSTQCSLCAQSDVGPAMGIWLAA